MSLTLKPGASGIWQAHGTVKGRRIRQSLGTRDRGRAEEALALLEGRIWRAETYGPDAVATFEDAALAYLEDGGDPRFVEGVLRHFKGRVLRTIKPAEIRAAARALLPEAAAATRNRQVITPARAIINHAADNGLCAPIRVRQFPVPSTPRKVASIEWLQAFRAAALSRGHPRLAALAWFLFETGTRISEACALETVDMINCQADLGLTKNGERYLCHFSPALRDELANLPAARNGRLFGFLTRSSVYSVWGRTCRDAGLPHITPHEAGRHSFATALHRMGWDANDIAQAGRWKSVRLVQDTYIHSDVGARAADAIGKELTKPRQGAVVKSLIRKGET